MGYFPLVQIFPNDELLALAEIPQFRFTISTKKSCKWYFVQSLCAFAYKVTSYS